MERCLGNAYLKRYKQRKARKKRKGITDARVMKTVNLWRSTTKCSQSSRRI
jgi:hypothetical protein